MIDYGKRAYIYWNLSKELWSVRQAGVVVEHAGLISMRDCKFLVGEKGRDRVRREGVKNVHAGVSGYLMEDPLWVDRMAWHDLYDHNMIWVKYNPYKNDTFVQRTGVCDDQHPVPVHSAEFVFMDREDLGDGYIPRVMALEPDNCQRSERLTK